MGFSKRGEEGLRQVEALLDAVPDALLVADAEGAVRYANPAALALLARRREELLGRPAGFAMREGETVEVRLPPGGDERVGEVRVAGVDWQGEKGYVASIREVTEKRRGEPQQPPQPADPLASVESITAEVAHGINNPLSAVMANLDLATHEIAALARHVAIPEELQEELSDALDAAERVRQIVRDVRLLAPADESGPGPVNVERVIDWTLRMAWNEIRTRARVVKQYGKVPPIAVNEARLGQALLNLLVNAAQAIPEGDLERNEIRIATSLDREGRVVVSVIDSGGGISPETRERLFALPPPGGGADADGDAAGGNARGSGLVLCHRIVTALGGEISVEGEPGKPTEVRVILPVGARPGRPPAAVAAPPRRGRVLVIDDEVIVGQAVKRILARHDVIAVEGAGEALALLGRGDRFDVVLCDLIMPEATGMDFLAEVQRTYPKVADRVVFMTGGAFTPAARAFVDRVKNPCLAKPFNLQRLCDLVDGFVV